MKETEMTWPTVKWQSTPARSLEQRFGIAGYPTLVILSPEGKFITDEGRRDVLQSPDAIPASWKR